MLGLQVWTFAQSTSNVRSHRICFWTFMQVGALCGSRLLGRPDFYRTFALCGLCPLSRLDIYRTFALSVEHPNSGILASGRTEEKTDFLNCKVSNHSISIPSSSATTTGFFFQKPNGVERPEMFKKKMLIWKQDISMILNFI
jgi:hypothetical protein